MKKILLLLLVIGLLGCAGQAKKDNASDSSKQGKGKDDKGAQVGSVAGQGSEKGTALAGKNDTVSYHKNAINEPGSVLSEQIVYFDFDSSSIREDFVELIKHHGKYLALNPTAKVRLEGHTDERGSREHNVALADRRAQAVKKLLLFEGASSNQMTVISYGEEKPAVLKHNEDAWRLNRRAEFVYGE